MQLDTKGTECMMMNPAIRLRNEGDRCLVYVLDDFFHTPDNLTVLLPQEALLLLLFDGKRTLREAAKDFAYLFSIDDSDENKLLSFVTQSLKNISERMKYEDLLTDAALLDSETIRRTAERYDAGDFIIPKEKIHFDACNLHLSFPLSLTYNVMTSCGFDCLYCYHPRSPIPDLISLERLDTIFAELSQGGCESIMLTGGDPMLRSDIDEVLKCLHAHDLFYTLSTKTVLSDERIRKLRGASRFTRFANQP